MSEYSMEEAERIAICFSEAIHEIHGLKRLASLRKLDNPLTGAINLVSEQLADMLRDSGDDLILLQIANAVRIKLESFQKTKSQADNGSDVS